MSMAVHTSAGAAKSASVANLLLDIRNNSSLRARGQGENVANGQGSVLAGVDELTGVEAFIGNEGLGVLLVAVTLLELVTCYIREKDVHRLTHGSLKTTLARGAPRPGS